MKLWRTHRSHVITVPPSKLKLLGWKEGDELDMNVIGDQLVVKKV